MGVPYGLALSFGSRRRFLMYFWLYVGIPSNGSKFAAAAVVEDDFALLPIRALLSRMVKKGPSWMRERRARKEATWAFSFLERGAGGEGLYGCGVQGQSYGGFERVDSCMVFLVGCDVR